MSKIFQSGSMIEFESIRFQDLESMDRAKGSYFVPKFPVESDKMTTRFEILDHGVDQKKKQEIPENKINFETIAEEAFTKGKVAGRLEAEEKLHAVIQAMTIGLEQISSLRKSLLDKSKEDMVRLIIAVVRRIIQTEVEEKHDVIVKTVSRALKAAIQSDKYHIRVNPEDLKIVTEHEPLFLAVMKGLQHIYFIADETVSRGGCIAESQAGEVDATIESQITEIYDHLLKQIE